MTKDARSASTPLTPDERENELRDLLFEGDHDDVVEYVAARVAAARAEGEKAGLVKGLSAAIEAHNNLHGIYGNSTACRGGIGASVVTFHCAVGCDNEIHEDAQEAWRNVARAAQGDPDNLRALVASCDSDEGGPA